MVVWLRSCQVMADAASEAMETILANCRARGSVAFILNAALSDKSKVVRGQCSKLVVLMLEVGTTMHTPLQL